MGSRYSVTCQECNHSFMVSDGGGFFFHLLHCDRCGKNKSVQFESLGELHLRFLKGLIGPYSIVSKKYDEQIQAEYAGEPISESEYHFQIENNLDSCRCGGRFKFDAPQRCPKCRSTKLLADKNGDFVLYD